MNLIIFKNQILQKFIKEFTNEFLKSHLWAGGKVFFSSPPQEKYTLIYTCKYQEKKRKGGGEGEECLVCMSECWYLEGGHLLPFRYKL